MLIEEARELIAKFMAAYSNYNPIDTELAAQIWANVTEEYTYEQVNKAFQIYVRTNTSGFAPNPGQIIDEIYDMTVQPIPTEPEAWAMVAEILSSDSGCKSKYEALPEIVKRAVGSYEVFKDWLNNDNLNKDVARASFSRCYAKEAEKERKLGKLPSGLKAIEGKENIMIGG